MSLAGVRRTHVGIAVCGQAARPPVPVMAAHKYLVDADRTTAQTQWRQPFFLPTIDVPNSHKGCLKSIRGSSRYPDLIILAETACQIPVKSSQLLTSLFANSTAVLSDLSDLRFTWLAKSLRAIKPKPLFSCTISIPAMAHIAPFRAFRYDPARVDLTKVVTQPYDKITPEMQSRYYDASPHNLVRIILGKAQPTDHLKENVYTRAAASFQDWRRQGIFLQDPEQSLYQYIQRFQPPGGGPELERRGFIALGKIEDYSAGIVHRHEQTLAKPKADRLELLRATRAHFGQLFMLYSDPGLPRSTGPFRPPRQIWKTVSRSAMNMEFCIKSARVSDPSLIELVRDKMRDKKLIIADGHHRYETAMNYRNQRRAQATRSLLVRTGSLRTRHDDLH